MWLCPYCGRVKDHELGSSPACCGEVHCIDLGDKKMTDDELDEFMERIFKPNEPPKETGNGTAV